MLAVSHAPSEPTAELQGVWDDLQVLARKTPQVISQVVAIVNKAEQHLPIIVKIVDKSGKYLPDVLKALEKIGPYLPRFIKMIEKAAPKLPQIIATIEQAEDVILAVVEDPALPAVVQRLRQIRALHTSKNGLGQAAPTPLPVPAKSTKPGVGLDRLVRALDLYLYIRRRPWLPWVVGGGAFLVLFGLGFGVGRLTAKRA